MSHDGANESINGSEVAGEEEFGAAREAETAPKSDSTKSERNIKKKIEKKEVKKMESAKGEEEVAESTAVVTNSTFESLGVCEPLCEACNTAGWTTATRIQKEVLPYAFQGRDVIGLAETGSGYVRADALRNYFAILKNLTDDFG